MYLLLTWFTQRCRQHPGLPRAWGASRIRKSLFGECLDEERSMDVKATTRCSSSPVESEFRQGKSQVQNRERWSQYSA